MVVTSGELRRERFERGEDFFERVGSSWMKLSRPAALKVVEQCSSANRAVSIVEGGIWHDPGFEARLDAIWHSDFDKQPDNRSLMKNNADAHEFLASRMPADCDTAIITVFKD